MSYATVDDVQALTPTTFSEAEASVCGALLAEAAVIIDAYAPGADPESKKVVSVRMALRCVGTSLDAGVPMGATQGSMSALGYSQSWTLSNGAVGELYLTKIDKKLLGVGDKIGSYSPVEEMARGWPDC